MSQLHDLQQRCSTHGVIHIEPGRGSLSRIVVTSDLATAEIYLHGGQLTHFQPRGAEPVIFLSRSSYFETGKPIRGGVPIVFPWFGPRRDHLESPAHGLARILSWQLESCDLRADGSVRIVLDLESDESTLRIWPHSFALRMTFVITEMLDMTLEVRNSADQMFDFEEAFHTYLRVGDIRQVAVEGLNDVSYIDKVDAMQAKIQPHEPIRFAGETDRVYLKTQSSITVHDPVMNRRILIEKEGSDATVVWNPWIAKARAMPDFGDG